MCDWDFNLRFLMKADIGLVPTEAGMHGLPRVAMKSPGLDESRHVANLVRQSGLFDEQWYEERYPDVKSSCIGPA